MTYNDLAISYPAPKALVEVKTYSIAGMRAATLFYKGTAVLKIAWRNKPLKKASRVSSFSSRDLR